MIVYVDILDRCHLRCPTCVRGARAMPNTRTQMPIEKFQRIVRKAVADGVEAISMFNWIEPFLCKNLADYVHVLNEAKVSTSLSSTLSLPRIDALEPVLAGVEGLLVSMSGYDQEIYQINHVGGRAEWVIANLERIAELKRNGRVRTMVTVKFIRFDYNVAEEEKLRALADRLNFNFEIQPGSGHPLKWSLVDQKERVGATLASFRSGREQEPTGHVCPMIFNHTVLDANGDVFLCCAFGNFETLKIGPYLDLSYDQILYRRYTHPYCNSCDWTRRAATPQEHQALTRAFASQLG